MIGGTIIAHNQLPISGGLVLDRVNALYEELDRGIVDRDHDRDRGGKSDRAWDGGVCFFEPGFVLLADISFVELACDPAFDFAGSAFGL